MESCPRCQSEMALWLEFEKSEPVEGEGAAVAWIERELKRRRQAAPVAAVPWWKRLGFLPAYRMSGALAALVVLAGVTAFVARQRAVPVPGGGETEMVFRSESLQVTAPVGDVDLVPQELQWKVVSGAARYSVEVLEVDRHSVWRGETSEARVTVPAEVRRLIVPGKTLLWEVTAKNGQGQTVANSGPQRFRLKNNKKTNGEEL